ncbi:hypothetical protein GCM10011387_15790 [Pedobacter quisquiliarum]|uniref:Uncharacterized protein n=1 Tax=Pedobacter quisquiliarum TaxID=1834438 RepID=A0A916U700_9SPHI|nr:hypothetical protein [Pedobacter quisquiliarum]GGC63060.1 hypothetical protein GCM10011387_15790 [Pedobacter quisquiliarum]
MKSLIKARSIFQGLLILLLFAGTAAAQEKAAQPNQQRGSKLNVALAKTLDSIYDEDQRYRRQMSSVAKQHGWESKEPININFLH